MKRILSLLILIVPSLTVANGQGGQKVPLRRLDDGFWERKNVIGIGISAMSFNGNHTSGFLPMTINYDRRLKFGLTVGGLVHKATHSTSFMTDSYEIHDIVTFFGIRIGYDIKIASFVRFRIGLGGGLASHYVGWVDSGCMEGPCRELPHTPAMFARWHILVDAHWVFRIGRSLELMLAPLIVSPSQLIFSPKKDAYYNGYYNWNIAPLRLSVRF